MNINSILRKIRVYFRISIPIMTILSYFSFYTNGELIFGIVVCYNIFHLLFMMYFHHLFSGHYAQTAKKMFCKRIKLVAFINILTCILSILPSRFPKTIFSIGNIILLIYTCVRFCKKNNSQKRLLIHKDLL